MDMDPFIAHQLSMVPLDKVQEEKYSSRTAHTRNRDGAS